MSRTDVFDLAPLRLRTGEGRRLELEAVVDDLQLGDVRYAVGPSPVPMVLDVSKMVGGGWSLRLRFSASLQGPCMRCLEAAEPRFHVDAREVDQAGAGEELDSPYVEADEVDLHAWARDAFALTLPAQVLCRPDCAGLCPECGKDLNTEPHEHERAPDPRWAALRDLQLGG